MYKVKKMDTHTEDRFEIRLSGSGGQGLIFAGTVLAEAIGIYDGKNVAQTQSYGPEARGGASHSDIIISPGEIFYPKPIKLDILLALTQESCDKYCLNLKDDGILLIDSGLVTECPSREFLGFPFTQKARENLGTIIVTNIVALGTLAALTKIVSRHALNEAVKKKAPKGTQELNLKALELGYHLARSKRLRSK